MEKARELLYEYSEDPINNYKKLIEFNEIMKDKNIAKTFELFAVKNETDPLKKSVCRNAYDNREIPINKQDTLLQKTMVMKNVFNSPYRKALDVHRDPKATKQDKEKSAKAVETQVNEILDNPGNDDFRKKFNTQKAILVNKIEELKVGGMSQSEKNVEIQRILLGAAQDPIGMTRIGPAMGLAVFQMFGHNITGDLNFTAGQGFMEDFAEAHSDNFALTNAKAFTETGTLTKDAADTKKEVITELSQGGVGSKIDHRKDKEREDLANETASKRESGPLIPGGNMKKPTMKPDGSGSG